MQAAIVITTEAIQAETTTVAVVVGMVVATEVKAATTEVALLAVELAMVATIVAITEVEVQGA